MKSSPLIPVVAMLAASLSFGCAAKTKPPMPAEYKASVLAYARQYPANPANNTPEQQQAVLGTFRRAADGSSQAIGQIFAQAEAYGSGDSEEWCKVPWALLNAVGDQRFASALASQPPAVQSEAFRWLIGPFGGTKEELQKQFPATAQLYGSGPS